MSWLAILPGWLKAAAAALVAILAAAVGGHWVGKRDGKASEQKKQLERDVKAAKDVKDRHAEIQDEDRDAVIERLTGKRK